MNVTTIDHVNLRIPTDGIDTATEFYGETLGFDIENLDEYEAGERSIFSVRLADEHIIHLRPSDDFERPSDRNFDHVAFVVADSMSELKSSFETNDIEIEYELDAPTGATGDAPAVYVRDPFGYLLEIKVSN